MSNYQYIFNAAPGRDTYYLKADSRWVKGNTYERLAGVKQLVPLEMPYVMVELGSLGAGAIGFETGDKVEKGRERIAAYKKRIANTWEGHHATKWGLRFRWDYQQGRPNKWVPEEWFVPDFPYYVTANSPDNAIDPRKAWGWAAFSCVMQARYCGSDFVHLITKPDMDPDHYLEGMRKVQPPWTMDEWVYSWQIFLRLIMLAEPDLTLVVDFDEDHPILSPPDIGDAVLRGRAA